MIRIVRQKAHAAGCPVVVGHRKTGHLLLEYHIFKKTGVPRFICYVFTPVFFIFISDGQC